MTGFLEQLAGIAIGDPAPGSAVADLPPRFGVSLASATEHADPAPTRVDPAEPASLMPRGDGVPCATAPDPGTPARQPTTSAAPDAAPVPPVPVVTPPRGEESPRPPAMRDARPVTSVDGSGQAPAQPARHSASRAAVSASRHEAPPQGPAATAARRQSATPHVQQTPGPAEGGSAQRVPAPALVLMPARMQAPLSEAALAPRRSAPHQPTVVHVTIDRLDVRAPAAPQRQAEAPRRRPQPSVSLSDYLGGGGLGGSDPGAGRGRP